VAVLGLAVVVLVVVASLYQCLAEKKNKTKV
jgi:hypothetical protein